MELEGSIRADPNFFFTEPAGNPRTQSARKMHAFFPRNSMTDVSGIRRGVRTAGIKATGAPGPSWPEIDAVKSVRQALLKRNPTALTDELAMYRPMRLIAGNVPLPLRDVVAFLPLRPEDVVGWKDPVRALQIGFKVRVTRDERDGGGTMDFAFLDGVKVSKAYQRRDGTYDITIDGTQGYFEQAEFRRLVGL
jgi:hypothetical protein